MQDKNFLEYIKRMISQSGMMGKLIAVNTAVFLFFAIVGLFEFLYVKEGLTDSIKIWFAAPGNPADLLYKPWSLITQLFTHGDFGHFLFNMVALFFTARIFVQFFGEKRLLTTYLLGGLVAYLVHISAYYVFPVFSQHTPQGLLGASGAVMAIFAAIAIHRPGLKVYFFGIIPMPIILLAVLYIIYDFRGIGSGDNVAHLAHLGGAFFGAISVLNINSPKNFMNRFERWFSKFKWPSFKRKPKMKVYTGDAKGMTDEEYNYSKKQHQAKVDAILDKISKKGYDGLTKEEKEILFNESNRK